MMSIDSGTNGGVGGGGSFGFDGFMFDFGFGNPPPPQQTDFTPILVIGAIILIAVLLLR